MTIEKEERYVSPPNQLVSHADASFVLKCGALDLYSLPLDQLFGQNGEHKTTHVVTVNAEIFVLAHEDRRLADILGRSVNTIDGRVLQFVCRLLYPGRRILRQNGANFVFDLAEHCRKRSQRFFLLGGSEDANGLAVRRLADLFPGLEVQGFSPPVAGYPFPYDWNRLILGRIKDFSPKHLVVCFGPQKQEYWIDQNRAELGAMGVNCAYGLGGTIDFISGTKPRAPRWIEFIGGEWLFRLACEPRARFFRTLRMFKMPLYLAKTNREVIVEDI